MEEKINLLYNFLYNENYKTCFDIDKIQLGKIKIEDIKITNQEESLSLLKEIISSKLSYNCYNTNEQLIYLKRFSDSFPVTIKIGFYTDESDNLSNKANNDAVFSYLLSQLVINKKTQHILLPIVNFDISFEKIEPLLKNLPIYKIVKEKIDYNEIKNTLSVRVREHFLQSKILKEYIEKNSCDYKPLIFQVIHTLAVLQKEFPGFRHNNLTPDNILIYINKKPEDILYEFGSKRWKLENINFHIKIGNFEKSTLPKYYGVKNQRDTDVPYITQLNDYFDIHTFLNALINKNGLLNLLNCELETKNFIDKVVPVKLRGKSTNETLFKPSDLLKDVYFSKFIYKEEKIQQVLASAESELKDTEINNKESDESIATEVNENKKELESNESVNQNIDNTEETNNIDYSNLKLGKMKMRKDYKNIFGAQENIKQTTESLPPWDPRHPKYDPNYKKDKDMKRSKPWDKDSLSESSKVSDSKKEDSQDSDDSEDSDKSEDSSESISQNKKLNNPKQPQEKLKPWDPNHPNYNPNLNKKEIPKREESIRKEPFKKEEPKTRYEKEVKPWDKKEDVLPIREQFKPREDINPIRPTIMRPNENFQETKILDTMDYQTPPTFIPLYDPATNAINKLLPYVPTYTPNVPVNKIYNISLSNPTADHSTINMIYEDILPGEKTIYTFLTLKERDAIKNSLRNSVLNKYDGEELTINTGKNSILSWIKIYDLNPYNNNPNSYVDLPTGFSIYRSAYPIKYNRDDNTLKSTPTSVAINIRIYQLSTGAIITPDYKNGEYKYCFDVWRELDYYKRIDKIIKNKQSPNFINILLYFFDSVTTIDFDLLLVQLKDKILYQKQNNELVKKIFNIIEEEQPNLQLNDPATVTLRLSSRPVYKPYILQTGGGPKDSIDLTKIDKKKLVILTEGPNVNILKWKSRVYDRVGSVSKMISTGHHTLEVWRSILFQMVYACCILEKEEMYFNNFNLKNNFFIKEVQTETTSNLCWLYKVNNIEYYIPNYGYVLVIDSNYSDVTEIQENIQYKIYGKAYDKDKYDSTYIKTALKKIMNDEWKLIESVGLIENNLLHEDVIKLMRKIDEELDKNAKIIDILPNCFPEFFNNKIGNLITRAEKENFSNLNKPNYKEGALMIRQKRYDEYDWVIYIGSKKENNKKIIITKELENYVEKEVFGSSLFSYPENVIPDNITIIDTFIY
jgi:hypothetical protein